MDAIRVADIHRLANTRNGNPRYRIALSDGRALTTEPNASFWTAFSPGHWLGRAVTVELDTRGRIARLGEAAE